jgi:hypothetical protein
MSSSPTLREVETRNRLASAVLRGAGSRRDYGGADQADRGVRRTGTNQQYAADLLEG